MGPQMRRRLLIGLAAVLVAVLLVVCCAPLLVAGGLRIWAQRAASREGLRIELGQIEAPLLKPVVIRNIGLRSGAGAPLRIEGGAERVEVGLNLAGIFSGSNRSLHSLRIEGLTLRIAPNESANKRSRPIAWSLFQHLQAESFNFSRVNLHLDNGLATIEVRDGALTGSELESGTLSAGEVTIAAPWFHNTLFNLHGATSWHDNRLSLGALSLIRGLDIDTLTIDLSQIGDSRIAMELNVNAFGGKLRARISSDDRGGKRIWDVAGNGSGVSLAQMSDAFEWSNRASGSLHASKFTFRGEVNDLRNATASLWAEISGLTWRDRTADTVMIGASLYNREVELEQLYIKQRNNQLTLSGEFGWPEKPTHVITPIFRGDLNASIRDVGEFARLFGWSPTDFAGQLSANGSVNAHEGKLGGELSVFGNSLRLFGSPIESLEAKLGLEESRVTITQLELRQTGDFFHGEGSFALAGNRSYNGAFQTSVAEIANYRGFIPREILPISLEGSVAAEWKGRGTNDGDSGTFQVHAKNLRVANGPLVPLNADLEADYSPESIFFKQFHFWNEHADLSSFVGLGKNYVQAQGLRFDLNRNARVYGNIFLPISARKFGESSSWLAALGTDPFFDVDLTVDALDLTELAAALETKPDLSGLADAKLQFSGTPGSLQGKSEIHLRDFVLDNPPALSADGNATLAFGMANLKASVAVRGSNLVKVEGAVPIQLEKRDGEFALASNGPLSATVDFPAVFLANLPSFISRGVFTRGILSGNLNLSDSVQHPLITGSADLTDGQLLRGTAISAGVTFKGRNAIVDFAHLKERDADISARGEIRFEDIAAIRLTLLPNASLTPTLALSPDDCVSDVSFYASPAVTRLSGTVDQINLRGGLGSAVWTISLSHQHSSDSESGDEALAPRTFPLCRHGKTLSLGLSPALFP